MRLNDTKIRNAKPEEKPYRMGDGERHFGIGFGQ